jgi:hypothetical protein
MEAKDGREKRREEERIRGRQFEETGRITGQARKGIT